MIAVRFVCRSDGSIPLFASNLEAICRRNGIADLVVILNRIFGFVFRACYGNRAASEKQERRIEDVFLSQRMDLEKRSKPSPDRIECIDVRSIDLSRIAKRRRCS